jgi:hypothetical protein
MWVFHGTRLESVKSILTKGFMVGGRDITAVNGTAYGQGVYTAIGPDDPFQYGQNMVVILAKALPGATGERDDGSCDCWKPRDKLDWVIFREGKQLLPVYVLLWCGEVGW